MAPVVCPECGDVFSHRESLQRHISTRQLMGSHKNVNANSPMRSGTSRPVEVDWLLNVRKYGLAEANRMEDERLKK